jgi:hypothetical protein
MDNDDDARMTPLELAVHWAEDAQDVWGNEEGLEEDVRVVQHGMSVDNSLMWSSIARAAAACGRGSETVGQLRGPARVFAFHGTGLEQLDALPDNVVSLPLTPTGQIPNSRRLRCQAHRLLLHEHGETQKFHQGRWFLDMAAGVQPVETYYHVRTSNGAIVGSLDPADSSQRAERYIITPGQLRCAEHNRLFYHHEEPEEPHEGAWHRYPTDTEKDCT